jgi:hypothetical protein
MFQDGKAIVAVRASYVDMHESVEEPDLSHRGVNASSGRY